MGACVPIVSSHRIGIVLAYLNCIMPLDIHCESKNHTCDTFLIYEVSFVRRSKTLVFACVYLLCNESNEIQKQLRL